MQLAFVLVAAAITAVAAAAWAGARVARYLRRRGPGDLHSAAVVGTLALLAQVGLVVGNEVQMANSRAELARGARGNFADLGANLGGGCCVTVEVVGLLAVGAGVLSARRYGLAGLVAATGAVALTCLVAGKVYWRESRGLW